MHAYEYECERFRGPEKVVAAGFEDMNFVFRIHNVTFSVRCAHKHKLAPISFPEGRENYIS